MVPEGLVLLTSVVFAVAAMRFGQRGIVAQELASVEMRARADIVCLDKTGTLTDGKMRVERVIPVSDIDAAQAMGALAAADPNPNSTLRAIRATVRITSIPFIPLSWMSTSITEGFKCRASRTASSPVLASPTTRMEGSCSSNCRVPSRTIR
jgi:magnesium-transporting ATPase (P-type)